MFATIVKLVVLFFVIFDPLMSFAVFFTATEHMKKKERGRTAMQAIMVAAVLSFAVLIFGESLLEAFNTNLSDLKVAGGIILGILGVKMALGQSITEDKGMENKSAQAIGSIIGTPLLTGPAAITAIIISTHDYGAPVTGLSIGIVLVMTAVLFSMASAINRLVGKTAIQVMSTILGVITLAWGVMFVREGLLGL
jgi:multiple antibiotic resistance protein